jgi:hypothetical protein
VITDDTAFLVCSGAERNIEYVQYSFWRAPHDLDLLWRVTIGYRLGATTRDFADARDRLVRVLGEPQREAAADPGATNQARAGMQLVSWDDPFISVSLGARWTDHPDPGADRMLVTWTDRRMQKLMQARGKKEPKK